MTDSLVWLIGIAFVALVVGLVLYASVKRSGSASAEAKFGDASLKLKTTPAPAPPPVPEPPSATAKLGKIQDSNVDNLAPGSASIEGGDVVRSEVRNEAGRKP